MIVLVLSFVSMVRASEPDRLVVEVPEAALAGAPFRGGAAYLLFEPTVTETTTREVAPGVTMICTSEPERGLGVQLDAPAGLPTPFPSDAACDIAGLHLPIVVVTRKRVAMRLDADGAVRVELPSASAGEGQALPLDLKAQTVKGRGIRCEAVPQAPGRTLVIVSGAGLTGDRPGTCTLKGAGGKVRVEATIAAR